MWAGAWLYFSGTFGRGRDTLVHSFQQIASSNGFAVQDILVEGRRNADPNVLLGLLNIERGDPIFSFDLVSAQKNLEKISWIEEARVERRLPGTIYVSIRERRPFALWQNQGKLRLIDEKGVVITDIAKEMAQFRTLPLVVGDGAPDHASALFALVNAEPMIVERLESSIYVGNRRWDMKLKNNITVRLPENDTALALRRLAEAEERDGLLDKNIDSIDLREQGRIVVRTKPGAVQDYKASYKTGSAI